MVYSGYSPQSEEDLERYAQRWIDAQVGIEDHFKFGEPEAYKQRWKGIVERVNRERLNYTLIDLSEQELVDCATGYKYGSHGCNGGQMEGAFKYVKEYGQCADTAYPYYKAVRLKSLENINNMDSYRSPRVLIDAWSSSGYGGTGKQIDRGLIEIVQEKHKLWLAGGINPENVREIISNLSPELIDVSSHLEKSPGRKDPSRMSAFFKEVL